MTSERNQGHRTLKLVLFKIYTCLNTIPKVIDVYPGIISKCVCVCVNCKDKRLGDRLKLKPVVVE